MLAGYEIWTKFTSYGVSAEEYNALSKRLESLRDLSNYYIKELSSNGIETLDDIELDMTTAYYFRRPDESRLTPWFMHQCGVGAIPIDRIPDEMYVFIEKIVDRALPVTIENHVYRVSEIFSIITRILALIDSSEDEVLCVSGLHIIDLCIIEMIKIICVFRIRLGLIAGKQSIKT